jgi:hypothetical protein
MTDQPPEPADFYLGRGANAEYLGSLIDESGAPEDIDVWTRFQSLNDENFTVSDFREEVADLLHALTTEPDSELWKETRTWPWDYPSSDGTPWAYVFDAGTVYVYRYGVEMAAVRCNYTRNGPGGIREPRRPQSVALLFPAFVCKASPARPPIVPTFSASAR